MIRSIHSAHTVVRAASTTPVLTQTTGTLTTIVVRLTNTINARTYDLTLWNAANTGSSISGTSGTITGNGSAATGTLTVETPVASGKYSVRASYQGVQVAVLKGKVTYSSTTGFGWDNLKLVTVAGNQNVTGGINTGSRVNVGGALTTTGDIVAGADVFINGVSLLQALSDYLTPPTPTEYTTDYSPNSGSPVFEALTIGPNGAVYGLKANGEVYTISFDSSPFQVLNTTKIFDPAVTRDAFTDAPFEITYASDFCYDTNSGTVGGGFYIIDSYSSSGSNIIHVTLNSGSPVAYSLCGSLTVPGVYAIDCNQDATRLYFSGANNGGLDIYSLDPFELQPMTDYSVVPTRIYTNHVKYLGWTSESITYNPTSGSIYFTAYDPAEGGASALFAITSSGSLLQIVTGLLLDGTLPYAITTDSSGNLIVTAKSRTDTTSKVISVPWNFLKSQNAILTTTSRADLWTVAAGPDGVIYTYNYYAADENDIDTYIRFTPVVPS